MDEAISENSLIDTLRQDPVIQKLLHGVKRPLYTVDESVFEELQKYFVEIKPISEVDILDANEKLAQIQAYRDRTVSLLVGMNHVQASLERLFSMAEGVVYLRPDVRKSSQYEKAIIVRDVVREVSDKLEMVKAVVNSAELVMKNLNSSYNSVATQLEAIKQAGYQRNLNVR